MVSRAALFIVFMAVAVTVSRFDGVSGWAGMLLAMGYGFTAGVAAGLLKVGRS